MTSTPTSLQCRACGGTMIQTRVARFNGCLQALGVLVLIVGLVAFVLSLPFLIASSKPIPAPASPPKAEAQSMPGEGPAQKLARLQREQARRDEFHKGADAVVRSAFGLGGIVSGGLGFLAIFGGGSLLLRKRIWRCGKCGAFFDRA